MPANPLGRNERTLMSRNHTVYAIRRTTCVLSQLYHPIVPHLVRLPQLSRYPGKAVSNRQVSVVEPRLTTTSP